MENKITQKDYINILNFYNKSIPKSSSLIKLEATKLMSEKLCKCIKKLDPINEARSIGICTKTIFNNKGFSRGKFSCRKGKNTKLEIFRKRKTMKARK